MNTGAFHDLFGTSNIYAKFIEFLRGLFEGNKTITGLDATINFKQALKCRPKEWKNLVTFI